MIFLPAKKNHTVKVLGKDRQVIYWMYDPDNNIVVALVQDGAYLRIPSAIEESSIEKGNVKKNA